MCVSFQEEPGSLFMFEDCNTYTFIILRHHRKMVTCQFPGGVGKIVGSLFIECVVQV